jgi:hypothetical protein
MAIRSTLSLIGIVTGCMIMLLGTAIAPLPGPFGLPIAIVGLMIALRSSRLFKRFFLGLVRRYPKFLRPIRRMLKKRAPFWRILYSQMLRVEKFILPTNWRPLAYLRHRFYFWRSWSQKQKARSQTKKPVPRLRSSHQI